MANRRWVGAYENPSRKPYEPSYIRLLPRSNPAANLFTLLRLPPSLET